MTGILEGLVAQAEAQGAARVTLQAIVEEAADAGAARALKRLGLMDERAGDDIQELRELVQGWRDVKKSALRSLVGWVMRTLVALLLLGLSFKIGLLQGEKP
ncbi:DUF6127 family protein [Sandarakinorhabdus oryzae]|uniref:DUF6127 family protein n=1 Tax=Sandarakinorhabdus oryzae TaxID=2675220 RepID=UPI0012E15D59|nr:DUF6127 family protein [Sandarakinorhabdus oryzae]